jgi:hypothetical protein
MLFLRRFLPSPRVSPSWRTVVLWGPALLAANLLGAGLPLASFQHPNFVGSGNCALCHSLLTDAARNDVSIDTHWRSSMMANSGKDPLWQAKVRSEILRNPALKSVIENKCATCHMPMARTQAAALNSPVEIHGAGFLNPANGYHVAAMDGVSCALCHQIKADGLGRSESFSGHYQIDTTRPAPNRLIYGPFPNPFVTQMQNNIGFTPALGSHLSSSAMCGVCHNLRTPFVDRAGEVKGEFPEQMIYSEWEHSAYNSTLPQSRSCADCHLPVANGGVVLSNRGGPGLNLPARSPFGQHHFVGGNVFMLDLLAANATPLQVTASPENFAATRQRTVDQLQRRTAALENTSLTFSGDELSIGLRVTNLAGHKLPAGIPSRRTWIHLEVRDAQGALLFSSGEPQADGRIVGNDADFAPATCEPHYDAITRADQVQIYEAVMEDTDGAVTYTLLRGSRYRKDNRLLPAGFVKATASSDVAPAGDAAVDGNFMGGSDDVLYRINRAGRTGPFQITARLLHQTVSYAFVADLLTDAPAAPEIAAFATLYNAASKTPAVITQLAFAADPAQLPNGTSNSDTRLLNLSSRARVGPGDVSAIAGFVLAGEVAKTVLIRAVGPTLSQAPFNLPGTLVDPSLTLYRGSTIVARNTGIATSTNGAAIASTAQQVGAFALGSSGNDSALLLPLAPGAYTAVVTSAANLTGVVLIEIYDVNTATAGTKLLNISTRAMAGAAENTLIAGIVLTGTTPKRMLFRAVGPGLVPFGVSGPLAQPTLTLYRSTQALATNTNWTTSAEASAISVASASVSAFTLLAGDSALLATLAPGSYTVQVTGPGTTTGVALVEAYELP